MSQGEDRPWRDAEVLEELAKGGYTKGQMAEKLGCERWIICRFLHKYDITTKRWRYEDIVAELVNKGLSHEEMAEELGCSKGTIRKWLDKHGLESDDRVISREKKWRDEDRLEELYDRGLSKKEMAEKLNCSPTTITNYLRKFGIEEKVKPWDDKERLDYLYRHRRMKMKSIADYLGCSEQTIQTRISSFGWDKSKRSLNYSILNYQEKIEEWYNELGLSTEEMSEKVGCSVDLMREWVLEYDLEPDWKRISISEKVRDEEWLRENYVDKQKSTSDISDELNISQSTVSFWLKKYDIEVRNGHMEHRGENKKVRSRKILKRLQEEGKNRQEIADELGCSQSMVRYWMDKYNIETANRYPILHDFDELKELIDQPLTTENVAKEVGCSKGYARQKLIDHGILEKQKEEYEELRDEEWMREMFVEENMEVVEIAEMIDCSPGTVHQWKNKHGLKRKWKKKEVLEELYIKKGMSQREIAQKFDCGDSSIDIYMKKHGMPTRGGGAPKGEEHPNWKGGHEDFYGSTWHRQRKLCIERDGKECLDCGMEMDEHKERYGESLHVHHVTPFREFEDSKKANKLDNLRTLCRMCHNKWEGHPNPPQPNTSKLEVAEVAQKVSKDLPQ